MEILANICLLAGGFFIFTSAIGIMRMPDFFSRLHPAGMTDSLGLPLVLFGVLLHSEIGMTSIKIILLIIFAMITSSTACHALARSALIMGRKPFGKEKKRLVKGK